MSSEVKVRCTKDGISVDGARDIGSTSDTKAGSLSQFLRIAECWWFTYCEKSPRQEAGCNGNTAAMREKAEADPNWKEICEKCHDGDIEPYYCEYYGEPNGCNSPLYGQHPKEGHGNSAAMRDALVWLRKTGHRSPEGGWMCITLKMTQKDGKPYPIEVPPYAEDVINAALSAPPRNCDVGTAEEQDARFVTWRYSNPLRTELGLDALEWAQMPYEADTKKEGGAE